MGMKIDRDIEPGEVSVIDGRDIRKLSPLKGKYGQRLCNFLFGYWEYDDVVVDGIPIIIPKQKIARWLAQKDIDEGYADKIEIVLPIPGSGIPYAEEYAAATGKPLIFGLEKYQFAHRSYPKGTLKERQDEARRKLFVLPSKVKGKAIVVIDDSIRKGTQILEGPLRMLKEAGARVIYLRLGSPRNYHYCRADYPPGYSDADLLANRFPDDEGMASHLGIEHVRFIGMEPYLNFIVEGSKLRVEDLCKGCHDRKDVSLAFDFLEL